MLQRIPIQSDIPNQRFKIALNGVEFIFEVIFNQTMDRWTLTMFDAAGTVLVAGVKLVLGVDLLKRYANVDLPQGIMALGDSSRQGEEASFGDLGDRVRFLYEDGT